MSLLEIIALLVVVACLAAMVLATRRAAAYRREQRDSADAGSSWRTDFGGDGGDSD